jgi:hypothetical protein
LAEVGFSARTTVAKANGTPARLSAEARSSKSLFILNRVLNQ